MAWLILEVISFNTNSYSPIGREYITCVPANIDTGQLQLIFDCSKLRMTELQNLVSTNFDIGQLHVKLGSSKFRMTDLPKSVLWTLDPCIIWVIVSIPSSFPLFLANVFQLFFSSMLLVKVPSAWTTQRYSNLLDYIHWCLKRPISRHLFVCDKSWYWSFQTPIIVWYTVLYSIYFVFGDKALNVWTIANNIK